MSWKLTSISKDAASGLYRLQYDTPTGPVCVSAKTVALTAPAYVAAELLKEHSVSEWVGGAGRAGPGQAHAPTGMCLHGDA